MPNTTYTGKKIVTKLNHWFSVKHSRKDYY